MKLDLNLDNLEDHLLFEKKIPKEIVLYVFDRDNYMCRKCNGENGISPHHVIFRSKSRNHHPDNLITLCFDCHRMVHDGKLIVKLINNNWFFGVIDD